MAVARSDTVLVAGRRKENVPTLQSVLTNNSIIPVSGAARTTVMGSVPASPTTSPQERLVSSTSPTVLRGSTAAMSIRRLTGVLAPKANSSRASRKASCIHDLNQKPCVLRKEYAHRPQTSQGMNTKPSFRDVGGPTSWSSEALGQARRTRRSSDT